MEDTARTTETPVFNISDYDRPVTRDDLGGILTENWPLYRKKVPTSAIRVGGPFKVATSEGVLSCADGWLCIDARGYPYPVADEEFQLIYERNDVQPAPTMRQRELTQEEKTRDELRTAALAQLRTITEDTDAEANERLTAASLILQHTQVSPMAGLFMGVR